MTRLFSNGYPLILSNLIAFNIPLVAKNDGEHYCKYKEIPKHKLKNIDI